MPQVIDFVVADAQASPAALARIADVICLSGESACPSCWTGEALARWPGSLVAVARAGEDGWVVATPGQRPVLLRVRAETAAAQVRGCAAVAYWWIVSGRPLGRLEGSHVVVSGGAGSSPGSDASSSRTPLASGAAVASNPASASER